MRKLLCLALAGLLALPVLAADAPKPTLKVGDPAPPLKVSKWLQGQEVKKFEPGKVYVVEFWATWCGPCIVMMPHMAEMQQQYKDKGVTFIGFSAKDPSNTEEKVADFVKKRGPKLKYTFAYGDDRETYDAWMKAAGQGGIPCAFVVDKAGKIAYIGHPMYLDLVVPKVVAGTWKGKESADELDKVEKDVNDVFETLGRGNSEASLKALEAFEAKHPPLAHIPYFVGPKLGLLVQAKKTDEARKFAEEVVAKATRADDPMMLRSVSAVLRSGPAKDNKELMALAVKAAEAGVKVAGDKDALALINLASTYDAAGDKARASEYGKKAVEAAKDESPGLKRYVEAEAKKFEEKKEEKKEKD